MKQIASFTINHDVLVPGMYTSRIDGDVVTYDLRAVVPNCGTYLENGAMHTVEHLFATYVRNSVRSDEVVYFGPMGCRTGFYFLVRDTVQPQEAIDLARETLDFIAAFAGEVPGTKPRECGNAAEHDLEGAKRVAAELRRDLEGWTVEQLVYPE